MNETLSKPEDLRVLSCLSAEKKKRTRLVNESGLPDSQVRRCLERLINKWGYTKRVGKGYYIKTTWGFEFDKGRETPMELTIDNEELIKIIDRFPTQAHRTIFWFWLASIVAKKYLLKTKRFENYNPAFVAIGETGDVKTLIAETLFRALGLDRTKHLIDVSLSSAKEILGRRYFLKEINDWRLKPSPYFDRIAICFDEAGQARDRKTFDAIMFYLSGRRENENDKTPITQLQTALVCMNPKDKWEIPTPSKRRCFILDTRPFDLDPRETADIGEEIAHSEIPRVNIEGLEVDIPYLSPEDLKLLKNLLFEGLKGKAEYRLVNPPTLEKVVLGWLLLTRTHDTKEAIFWGVEGCLTLCHTQGATVEGWRRTLREKKGAYLAGRDPNFEKKWIKEIETLEAEDQDIIDRGKDQEDQEDEKIDQDLKFEMDWEDTFRYWGSLIMFFDSKSIYPKIKRANRVAIKAWRDEFSKFSAIPRGKRTFEKLATIKRLVKRREPAMRQLLEENKAEFKRLEAEAARKVADDKAKGAQTEAIIKDRSDTAATLITNLWRLDTSTGHSESKELRRELTTIKKKPDSNYARTNFPRRQAAAVVMIGRFTEERELKGAPAAEQIQNGVTSIFCKIAEVVTGKKTKESTPERGESSPEIPNFRGQPDEGLPEKFGFRKGAPGSKPGKPKRGKSIYEKLRNGDYKKKKGKPEKEEFEGRPWEDKGTPGRPFED